MCLRKCIFIYVCFVFPFTGNYSSRIRHLWYIGFTHGSLFIPLSYPTLYSAALYSYSRTYKQSYSILTCGWTGCIPCIIWLIFLCKIHQIQRVVLDSLQNWSGLETLENSEQFKTSLFVWYRLPVFFEMRHNNFLPRKIARIYFGRLLLGLLLLLAVVPLPFTGVLFDVVIYDSAVGRNKNHVAITRLLQCVLRWVVGFSVVVSQWAEHLSTQNVICNCGSKKK